MSLYVNKLFDISNKIALITGATGQLGQAICKAFSEAKVKVIATDITLNKKKLFKSENIEYIKMDVTNKKSISRVFNIIFKKYKNIDILINNAGVSFFDPFEKRSEKSFDLTMDVNLKGPFFCIQEYSKKIKKNKKTGCIINICSIYGILSPDFRIYKNNNRKNSEIYGATKAGLIQMTRYFAVHLAKEKIRVNAISPGGIYNNDKPQYKSFIKNYSSRNPLQRMAKEEEIIGAIFYLSSNASSYTSGHNLVIDGGMSCW